MHVLFVTSSLEADGPGIFLKQLAARLGARKGWEVSIGLLRGTEAAVAQVGEVEVPLVSLAKGAPQKGKSGRVGGANEIAAAIQASAPDVVVTSLPRADLAGAAALEQLPEDSRPRLFRIEHGIHAWSEVGARHPNALVRSVAKILAPVSRAEVKHRYLRGMRHVERVVCVSQFVADQLAAEGVNQSSLEVIPNGIDLAPWLQIPSRAEARQKIIQLLNIEEPEVGELVLIGCVGGLREIKGQDILLQIFDELHTAEEIIDAAPGLGQRSTHSYLLLVGSGPDKDKLQDWVNGIKIADHVFFLGELSHDRIILLHAALDLYVQPSRMETFGLAVVEAMAAGLAVIGTDVGGLGETIGAAGVVSQPTLEDLEEQVFNLVENKDQRSELGALARERAFSNFDIKIVTEKYATLFEKSE